MGVMQALKEGLLPRAMGVVIAKNPMQSLVKILSGEESQR